MGGAWPRVPTEVVPRPLCPGSGKTIRGRHPACPHPRTNDKWSAQILLAHGWGHDVGFEARDGGQELVLLFLWHLELVESGDQVPDRNLPVALGDAETLVRHLHAAPDVNTWPARCRANLIHHQLSDTLLGISARAGEEPRDLFVGHQAADEIVRHCGNGIVAAQPLVERLRFLLRAVTDSQAGHHG